MHTNSALNTLNAMGCESPSIPPKVVADCFKFRNKYGLDVAMEALREGHRLKKITVGELEAAARICRVSNVMRPYMEMMLL